MKKITIYTSISLDPNTNDKWQEMSQHYQLSKSAMLRKAISQQYKQFLAEQEEEPAE